MFLILGWLWLASSEGLWKGLSLGDQHTPSLTLMQTSRCLTWTIPKFWSPPTWDQFSKFSQKSTTWEVFYELSRQRMLDKKRCQPGQKTSTPPASWSSWSSWSFLTQNSDELTRHFCFFLCFFFPWVFGAVWKFLATEIQHPRKNANSLKLKKYFLQICGWKLLVVLPFFFLNLFPGVDLDERNFPPVIRKGSLKRHQFFLTLWQIWIKKYSNSIT